MDDSGAVCRCRVWHFRSFSEGSHGRTMDDCQVAVGRIMNTSFNHENCVQTGNIVISPSNSWILLDSNTKHQTYNSNPSKIKDFIIIKYPRGNFTPLSDFRKIPWSKWSSNLSGSQDALWHFVIQLWDRGQFLDDLHTVYIYIYIPFGYLI